MDAFVENTIKEIREKVGDGKVLLAHYQEESILLLQQVCLSRAIGKAA